MVHLVVDFTGPDGVERLTYTNPDEVLLATHPAQVRHVLQGAEQARTRGLHVVGFVCYESATAFDDAFRTHRPGALPAAWFAIFSGPDQPADQPPDRGAQTHYQVAG